MDSFRSTSRRFLAIVVAIFCLTAVASTQIRRGGRAAGGAWEMLGTSHVDGSRDHDKIMCHGKDTFRALKFRVAGGAIQFDRVNIVYGNHRTQPMPFRFRIASGGTRTLDLPGADQDIAYVEFWYEKASWSNKPEVQLSGLR
jgi:hypothetical protein